MKRYSQYCAASLLTLPYCLTAWGASLFMTSQVNHINVGDVVTVDIAVGSLGGQGSPNLGGFALEVAYSTEHVHTSEITIDDQSSLDLQGYGAIGSVVEKDGLYVSDVALAPSSALNAQQPTDFRILRLRFAADSPGTLNIDLRDADLVDSDGNQIAFDLLPAPIVIVIAESDQDGDAIADRLDNCVLDSNPSQLDADQDGYGNACDADLNNSGLVTSTDFNLMRAVINQATTASTLAASADLNGSGIVTASDFSILRSRLNQAPGPSANH